MKRQNMISVPEQLDAVYVVRGGRLYRATGPNVECFAKAISRNQPTFTLVGQDACAIETIVHWKGLVKENRPDSPKLAMADSDIAIFAEWQDTHLSDVKIPD